MIETIVCRGVWRRQKNHRKDQIITELMWIAYNYYIPKSKFWERSVWSAIQILCKSPDFQWLQDLKICQNQHLCFTEGTHGIFHVLPGKIKKTNPNYCDLCFDVCEKVKWSRTSERRWTKSHILKWSVAKLHLLCRINLICKNVEYRLLD